MGLVLKLRERGSMGPARPASCTCELGCGARWLGAASLVPCTRVGITFFEENKRGKKPERKTSQARI